MMAYNITTNFAGNSNYRSSSKTTVITMSNTRVVDSGLSNSEIQKIIDNAKDKNVILFKGKSYSDINLLITKRLTLISNVDTVLKSSSSSPVINIKGKSASYSIVNGFNIQGKGNGVVITDSNYVRIINNDITTEGNGVVATGTTYFNITKNNINKNSKSGIVIGDATSTYIFNNNIKSNGADGIVMAKSTKVYIHGNTIKNNKANGISLNGTANGVDYDVGSSEVYINKNTVENNEGNGIYVKKAGNNINIKSNSIVDNKEAGIALGKIGSNTIQSNVISSNYIGIHFVENYIRSNAQDIIYNAIFYNKDMEVEAKDTYYSVNSERLSLGDNWYSDYGLICPKIKTNNIQFSVKQIGENTFQALFKDSNGNIANLLPDRTLTYKTNNGETISMTVSGGAATFTVNANNGDLVRATVDLSRRDNTFDKDSNAETPINGVAPSYTYPEIPYGSGDGNGNGGGSGNGNGNGNSGSNQGNRNNGNSTYSQDTDPSSGQNNNPVNDVTQSSESQSPSSSGASGSTGSQSQSVVKQIII